MTVHHEYAVKVGDRGWAVVWGDTIRKDPPDDKSGGLYRSPKDANQAADDLRLRFTTLGASDIAETVTVVARIVTTTYSGWAHPAETTPTAVNS